MEARGVEKELLELVLLLDEEELEVFVSVLRLLVRRARGQAEVRSSDDCGTAEGTPEPHPDRGRPIPR